MSPQFFGSIALGTCLAVTAQASEFRILQAEPFVLSAPTNGTGGQRKLASTTTVSVAGRQFQLTLESNERLLRSLSSTEVAALGDHELYRGQIAGVAGSWVRVSRIDGRIFGAMWDGVELYAIGPRAEIEAKMQRSLNAKASDAAIFRWADTEGGDAQACGLSQDVKTNPADQYRALVRELKTEAAATGLQQISVAIIGDYEFYTLFGSRAVATMLERMNVVDGIFSNQVGVSLVPTDFKVFDTADDPFTQTDASKLLDEVGSYRAATPVIRARGLAHLMTGRDLDGNTVGIAVMKSLCQPRAGVSLSQANNGSFTAPLIAAHELGHNFGAPHDGEAACASAPNGFLMAPSINGSSEFSDCSVEQMMPVVASAQCVTDYQSPDVAVSFGGGPFQAVVNQGFDVPIDIATPADGAVENVTVTVNLAGTIDSATLDNGSCSISGVMVTCQIAQLAAHETHRLIVRTTLAEPKTFNLSASVSAWKDDNDQNNSATTTLQVGTSAIPTPTPTPSPTPEPTPSPSVSGPVSPPKKGGGGGAFELLSMMGLVGVQLARRRRITGR